MKVISSAPVSWNQKQCTVRGWWKEETELLRYCRDEDYLAEHLDTHTHVPWCWAMASVLLTAQYCQQEEGRQQLPAAFTLPEHAPGVFIPLVRLTRWPCLGTCLLLCSVQVLRCAVCRSIYLLEKRGLGETQQAAQCQRTWDAHNSPTIIPFFVNLCNALFQMYTAKPRVSRRGKDTAFFSFASYQYSSL